MCVPLERRIWYPRVTVKESYEFVFGTQTVTLFFGWHSSITLKRCPTLGEEARAFIV